MKKKKRAVPAALIAIEVVLIVLFLFLTSWWFGFSYPYFDSIASVEKRIPGLSSGISPQGLCTLPDGGAYSFAMSGYISGQPSRVYLIAKDRVASEIKKVERYVTFTEKGEDIKTHFGGVTCSEEYMYIASGKKIVRIALEKILSADNAARIEIDDSFTTGFNNAYCYLFGGMLYVGEFYRPGNYETPSSHHMQVGAKTNHAVVYCYPLDETREGGIADTIPAKVLSVCDQVQGIAVTEERIFLSCSYALPDSRLLAYPNKLAGEADGTFDIDGHEVPLYTFEDGAGRELRMPCMSEEICFKDGRLFVLFESMSKKYRFVTFRRETQILSLDPASIGPADREKLLWGLIPM